MRRTPFPIGAIIITPHPNPFRNSLRSSQVLLDASNAKDVSPSLLPKIVGNIKLSQMKFKVHAEMSIMVTTYANTKIFSLKNHPMTTEDIARAALSLIQKMFWTFKNGEDIDRLELQHLADVGMKEDIRDLPLTRNEQELIQSCLGYR